jgi:hypothetical protein
MGARALAVTVILEEGGLPVVLLPGTVPTKKQAAQIDNPKAWADEEVDDEAEADEAAAAEAAEAEAAAAAEAEAQAAAEAEAKAAAEAEAAAAAEADEAAKKQHSRKS